MAASTSTSTGKAVTPRSAEDRTRTNTGRGREQDPCRGRRANPEGAAMGTGPPDGPGGSAPDYFFFALARRFFASSWYDFTTGSVMSFIATSSESAFCESAGFLASSKAMPAR